MQKIYRRCGILPEDATRADEHYLYQPLEEVIKAGATVINILGYGRLCPARGIWVTDPAVAGKCCRYGPGNPERPLPQ